MDNDTMDDKLGYCPNCETLSKGGFEDSFKDDVYTVHYQCDDCETYWDETYKFVKKEILD